MTQLSGTVEMTQLHVDLLIDLAARRGIEEAERAAEMAGL